MQRAKSENENESGPSQDNGTKKRLNENEQSNDGSSPNKSPNNIFQQSTTEVMFTIMFCLFILLGVRLFGLKMKCPLGFYTFGV